MTVQDQSPTETSALLPKTQVLPEPGIAPEGELPTGAVTNGDANGSAKAQDEESLHDEGGRGAQFEGMPEVRARLKYIFPALAIGVRIRAEIARFQPAKHQAGLPLCSGPNNYSQQLRQDWQ